MRFFLYLLTICLSSVLIHNTGMSQSTHVGIDLISNETSGWFNQIRFKQGSTTSIRHIITDHGGRDRMVIYPGFGGGAENEMEISGKVAFRTTDIPTSVGGRDIDDYSIFANGGILTDEILVITPWADYVFADNYDLMTFEELRSYIALMGHLPNMPSAKEVESDGLELKEITVLQQEKIEEAFLYILQLEEKIAVLEEKIEKLEYASDDEN